MCSTEVGCGYTYSKDGAKTPPSQANLYFVAKRCCGSVCDECIYTLFWIRVAQSILLRY